MLTDKFKLITFYILLTLTGILLLLIAIYNASREQLKLDTINSNKQFYTELLTVTRAEQYTPGNQSSLKPVTQLVPLPNDNSTPSINSFLCNTPITNDLLDTSRLNANGGYLNENHCSIIWTSVFSLQDNQPILVLQDSSLVNFNSALSPYIKRLAIPLLFFIWLTIWGALVLANLINRLRRQMDAVEHIALHDALTGLPNRSYFSDTIIEHISYSERHGTTFSLAVIDLNKFKPINDTYGHQFGDELLIQVADRLRQSIRQYDIACRLGGDEFLLLIVNDSIDDSLQLLKRIHQKLIATYTVNEISLEVGASIGIAHYPEHGTKYSDLFHHADLAMYQGKHTPLGGIHVFDPESIK